MSIALDLKQRGALIARLRVHPKFDDASPVVLMIGGLPMIVGNARSDFAAITLARCYRPDANELRKYEAHFDAGTKHRTFFMVQ